MTNSHDPEGTRVLELQSRLIDLSPAATIVRELDGTIRFWSQAAKATYGWSADEALGRRTHDLLQTNFPEPLEQIIAQIRSAGRWSGELRHRTKGGKIITVQSWWVAQFAEDGTVVELLESNVDITQRKQIEEDLRHAKERYRSLFEAIDEGFCIIEVIFDAQQKPVDYRFLETNPSFERHTGLVQACGKRMRELAPLHEEHWFQIYGRIALTGRPERFQAPAEQLHRWYDVYAFRLDPPERKQVAILFNDITSRKQAEADLAQTREELVRANTGLEQIVEDRTAKLRETIAELEAYSYTLAHDLRAPLRAIQGFATIARDECGDCAAGYLETVMTAARRMDMLIQDVLSYSKVSRELVRLGPVDTEKLLREIVRERPEFQAPRANVVLQAPLLPVIGHEAFLTQCFTNLLGNAVKFTKAGDIPRVIVSTSTNDGFVRINVSDNGIGIPRSAGKQLFGMFARVSHDYEGTGIGLAIVKKAVERMRGKVGFESEAGKGSCFWIELPQRG